MLFLKEKLLVLVIKGWLARMPQSWSSDTFWHHYEVMHLSAFWVLQPGGVSVPIDGQIPQNIPSQALTMFVAATPTMSLSWPLIVGIFVQNRFRYVTDRYINFRMLVLYPGYFLVFHISSIFDFPGFVQVHHHIIHTLCSVFEICPSNCFFLNYGRW